MNFKLILKKNEKILLENITFENFDKCLKAFDSGLSAFNKGMDEMLKELSADTERSNIESKNREKINKENLKKIWG